MAKVPDHQKVLLKSPPKGLAGKKPPTGLGKKPDVVASKAEEKKLSLWERIKGSAGNKKLGTAAGVGAVAALVIGAPVLVPVALAGGGILLYKYKGKDQKYSPCMTVERIKIYEQALATLKDQDKLRKLADEFEKAGCLKEADHLRKRATLRDLPPDVKQRNRSIFKKALKSTNPDAVSDVAGEFEKMGADGVAYNLRLREQTLRAMGK